MAWLWCPVCGKERRMNGKNNMLPHNRWDKGLRTTVPCEGRGRLGQKHTATEVRDDDDPA